MHVALRPILTRPVLTRAAFFRRAKTMASVVRPPYRPSPQPLASAPAGLASPGSIGVAGPVLQDPAYPGTATERMQAARAAARALPKSALDGDWKQEARVAILGACEWTARCPILARRDSEELLLE